MNFLKYLGVFILLIGVAILIVPTMIGNPPSNTILMSGLFIVIAGFLGHIFLNKKFE
jgi:hypothetical protein